MGRYRRAVVLVDGEHHPPVVRTALAELREDGTEPVLAVVLGGGEKLAAPGEPPDLGVEAIWPARAESALPGVLAEHRPDVVVDLSGEPVVSARRRLRLAAVTVDASVPYEAPGLRYDPPPTPARSSRPAVAVTATGKRTGKTALSGALTRHAMAGGRTPVVIAMGRGGPPEPTVIPPGTILDGDRLLEIVADGGHAASDFYEDALMTGAATVGCFRVGDGPAGVVATSNVPAGVAAADELEADLTVLEGSGAAIPPCHADATVHVVPAGIDPGDLGALLPLSFLRADLLVVTFADAPTLPDGRVGVAVGALRELLDELPRDEPAPIVLTTFRPRPLAPVGGRRVYVATTAPPSVGDVLDRHLTDQHGAEVVGITHHLADRPRLRADLDGAPQHDVLLTELKAAAVDVVVRRARDRGVDAVMYDHEAVTLPPDRAHPAVFTGDLATGFDRVLAAADRRHRSRTGPADGASGAGG